MCFTTGIKEGLLINRVVKQEVNENLILSFTPLVKYYALVRGTTKAGDFNLPASITTIIDVSYFGLCGHRPIKGK